MSEIIFERNHWRCRTFDECPLPGYLIVEMKAPVGAFSALSPEAAGELGTAITIAAAAIEDVVAPERVYVSRWGELLEDLHVHLFPRTRWALDCYRRAFPGAGPPSGPHLFEWARTRYATAEFPVDPSLDRNTVTTALKRRTTQER